MDVSSSCGSWSAKFDFDAETGALTVTEQEKLPAGCTDGDYESKLTRFLNAGQSLEIRDGTLYLTADPSSGALILQFENSGP